MLPEGEDEDEAMDGGIRTLTFLFTDIEGSTRRWESDPEAMEVELATHDALLRAVVAQRGGQVFKHTGDGVCAVFASPAAAVAAAVDAQRNLELGLLRRGPAASNRRCANLFVTPAVPAVLREAPTTHRRSPRQGMFDLGLLLTQAS